MASGALPAKTKQAIAAPALTAPTARGPFFKKGESSSQKPTCQAQRDPPPAKTTDAKSLCSISSHPQILVDDAFRRQKKHIRGPSVQIIFYGCARCGAKEPGTKRRGMPLPPLTGPAGCAMRKDGSTPEQTTERKKYGYFSVVE